MTADFPELVAFHLTGLRPSGDPGNLAGLDLRPALFAGYGDLTTLRYDYPLVLGPGGKLRSLSDIFDRVRHRIATENAGAPLGGQLRALEREIRTLTSRGTKGSLSDLWALAGERLVSGAGKDEAESLQKNMAGARAAVDIEGLVIDCGRDTAADILTHVWEAARRRAAVQLRDRVNDLIQRLAAILTADFMKSDAARTPEFLKSSVATAYDGQFDLEVMSSILQRAKPNGLLPVTRRKRLRAILDILQSQRFFAAAGNGRGQGGRRPYSFRFTSCRGAVRAHGDRLGAMVALIRAMAIAELELENRYDEARHDPFFNHFDESALDPDDVALFPSYLVCLDAGRVRGAEEATLIETLASDLPIKVLVRIDDCLGPKAVDCGRSPSGLNNSKLASMAIGANRAFVLQSASSNLYRLRDPIARGMAHDGPALFSVYSGAVGEDGGMPPYLRAAAAMQSRVFPAFTYDPGAGGDWAARFSVAGNPQTQAPWPRRDFAYEDEDLQRQSEEIAFTFADFAALDARYTGHFAVVPRSKWNGVMVSVTDYLDRDTDAGAGRVPYILMIDAKNTLHRVIVDLKVIAAARRCGDMWRALQELGGVNNSHARDLLEREKEIWERQREHEIAALDSRPVPQAKGFVPDMAPPVVEEHVSGEIAEVAEVEPAVTTEPYIETPRCTSCDECTDINKVMFAYDENKQAFIADADAGTYRELIEAAESCQVCIIHPGQPRNPDEPGLEALIARAAPFN